MSPVRWRQIARLVEREVRLLDCGRVGYRARLSAIAEHGLNGAQSDLHSDKRFNDAGYLSIDADTRGRWQTRDCLSSLALAIEELGYPSEETGRFRVGILAR